MKTLKYILLISLVCVSLPMAVAQSWAQQPGTEFHSTSTMMGSGSELPMAAVDGVMTAEATGNNMGGDAYRPTGPQRVDPNTPPEDPYDGPLGDTPWFFMLLLVAGYALRVARKHKLLSCLANRETR